MIRTPALAVLATSLAASGLLTAQGPTPIASWPCGSEPAATVDLYGTAVFAIGDEVWRSDGTAAGTFLLKATGTNAEPLLVPMGGHVYFTCLEPATGEELWRTDGTHAGTRLVEDSLPGITSTVPSGLLALGPRLLFNGRTPPAGGREPYVSDGTPSGTGLLLDVQPGAGGSAPSEFVRVGDRAVFLADDGTHGRELWVTDGTRAGTTLVTDHAPGATGLGARSLGGAGGRAFYQLGERTGVELLATDGTAAGTVLLHRWTAQLDSNHPLSGLVETAGRVWFCVQFYQGSGETRFELWSTDGTMAGTVAHGTVWPQAYRPGNPVPRLLPVGSRLLLEREDAATGREPWWFDPASGTFTPVHDFAAGAASSTLRDVAELSSGAVLLTFRVGTATDLWVVDPSGAAAPLRLRQNADSPMPVGSRFVYFTGEDGADGYELWRTDGTTAGTQRFGSSTFAGTRGLWIHRHLVGGGRLLVFGEERISANSYVCAPRLFAIDPGAHTVPLGIPGAAGVGAARLAGDDPVLGATASLRLSGLGPATLAAIVFDTPQPAPVWLLDSFWFYSGVQVPQVFHLGPVPVPSQPLAVPLTVPATAALSGLQVLAQGFGLGAPQVHASNALLLVVGR